MSSFFWQIIVAQVIIFGFVLYFLRSLLIKDTDSSVNRLESSYGEVQKKKEELSRKLLEIENEYKQRKEEAETIALEIKEKAQLEASEVRQEAFKKAKVETEDIIDKAHKTIDKIREDIRKEIESRTIEYCGELLKRSLSDIAREEINNVLIKEFLNEVRNTDLGKVNIDSNTVDILSVNALTESDRKEIKRILSEKLKKDFSLSEKIDDKVLGGVVLKFGGLTLDGSLASKIRESVLEKKQKIDER